MEPVVEVAKVKAALERLSERGDTACFARRSVEHFDDFVTFAADDPYCGCSVCARCLAKLLEEDSGIS